MNKDDLEKLKSLKPWDDDFARLLLQDPKVAMEILRILDICKGDEHIVHYETQKDIKIPNHRSASLDAFMVLDGKYIDIEIENRKSKALLKRARMYMGGIDMSMSYPQERYEDVPKNVIIFICSFDYYGRNLPFYTVERMVRQTGNSSNDDTLVLVVNGKYAGEDELGSLMKDFNCENPDDMQNAILRERVRYFKETEGGQKEMCKVWDDIRREGGEEKTAYHLKTLMFNFKIGLEDAMLAIGVSLDQKDMYLKMIAELG